MNIAHICTQRPIATLLAWITVIVAGAACWLQLPLAALPN